MLLSEAKAYIGKVCSIRWQDRTGKEQMAVSKVYDVTFVPLYGGYIVTDSEDIRLDRICSVSLMAETSNPPAVQAPQDEKIAA